MLDNLLSHSKKMVSWKTSSAKKEAEANSWSCQFETRSCLSFVWGNLIRRVLNAANKIGWMRRSFPWSKTCNEHSDGQNFASERAILLGT